MQRKFVVGLALLLLLVLAAGQSPRSDFDRTLSLTVKPYRFGLAGWEARTIVGWLGERIWKPNGRIEGDTEAVLRYVELGNRIKAITAGTGREVAAHPELETLQRERSARAYVVEVTLERQIRDALSDEGIYHPWDARLGIKAGFPPVNFELQRPPHLLVVSRRDRIETLKTVLLKSDLDVPSMVGIEVGVDSPNISSLVVNLGGFGAFPSIVSGDSGLHYVVETAVHEWVHQYLAFRPLGFRYLLQVSGIRHDPDIVAINETVANIVGKEIGATVMQRYYSEYGFTGYSSAVPGAFDFDREMRDIRKTVDEYLSSGDIDEAEKFMREKRDYLAIQGYHIRKLNQAYFAFNGQYADVSAFISPIGTELNELRARSTSLAEFLTVASSITGRDDLRTLVASDNCEVTSNNSQVASNNNPEVTTDTFK
ncbi:MAG: hypothetical protein HYX84_01850 [Chloroflexi bacterium]|nr:hypothetical protein [Chloroflexota bacterium]